MLTIRKLDQQDLGAIVQLFLSVFSQEPWNDQWPNVNRAKQYLADIINTPGYKGCLVKEDSRCIAAVLGNVVKWWSGDEFFVKEFFVDSEHQGRGVGSKLYDHLKTILAEENVKTIVLLTEKDVPAFRFYGKKGLAVSEDTVFMYDSFK